MHLNQGIERAKSPVSTPTRQFAGLVLAPVEPGKREQLVAVLDQVRRETIAAMRGRAPAQPLLPFQQLESLHYARLVLIDRDQRPALLAFATDYDGPEGESACSESRAWQHHLEDLQSVSPGLERVFAHCVGYRPGHLHAYLSKHRRRSSTFYVGASGRSKNQILWEEGLRRRVEAILGSSLQIDASAEQVRELVLRELAKDERYRELPGFPPQPTLEGRAGLIIAARTLALLAGLSLCVWVLACVPGSSWIAASLLVLVGLGLLVLHFRHLERTDPQFQPKFAEAHEHFEYASEDENEFLQNQLTHLVEVKPGFLRWWLIRAVFAVLSALAINKYNKGKLGDIPSIHFARWILIPDRGVLFFSNFDSSWQSYLGDFIDKASSGLTAVWSNTVLYPRTTWLLRAGSRDAGRFLAWTRQYQRPTQVWYAAYPGLSIVNVNANTEIRRGLAERAALDATSWLFHLRALERLSTDQQFGEEKSRDPSLALADIQGLVVWGYGHMPDARYLLLRLARPAPGLRRWLGQLPVNSAAADDAMSAPPEPLLNVAFTYRGMRELGLDESLCRSFSTPFVQGSEHEYRARVNGDVGASAPEAWQWGSAQKPVHIALLVFASSPESARRFAACYAAEAMTHGCEVVADLEARTLPGRKEHFGFRDGIAQPTIVGSGKAEVAGNSLAAGEFLLGHADGYGNITHSPQSPNGFNFGLNGSYLVLRQLEQDVPTFWSYCASQGQDAIVVASKMVGRWPSGAPLLRHPDRDPDDARFSDEDTFSYVANDENNDRYGASCPFGAHVRRSNPRDWLLGTDREESLRLSNLHRIIRRARPYGEPVQRDMSVRALSESGQSKSNGSGHDPRGLQFMCFNANIDRQFEFIQQQWCNNPKFAGLTNDPDPLVGARRSDDVGLDGPGFTLQSDVRTGVCARRTGLTDFVRVVGSAYFFMPAIPALRLLGADLLQSSKRAELEVVPPDEQLHIDGLIQKLGDKMKRQYIASKTLRDAHPKMHGCVKALFHIDPQDLAAPLRIGLFADKRTYSAWVRFSNASGEATRDDKADIRGVAIKLMGVDGYKLLEGEEGSTNQDLLLISHDTFVARDVAEFDALVGSLVSEDKLAMPWFLLRHPRVARNLLQALQKHSSPLEIRYFSVAPYLLASRAVKYSLSPCSSAKTPIPARPSPNYLREAMKAMLQRSSVRLDFSVQLAAEPLDVSRTPIEDVSVAWDPQHAPFHKVATLEILAQEFDTRERQEFGDNLSFNPWRCLPEHRPLGGMSRARRQVYRALSALRHDRNAIARAEPALDVPQPEWPRGSEPGTRRPRT
jgi:Dyp-type peroxidase family